MSGIDLSDVHQAPRDILDLYIEQLFAHNGAKKIATAEEIKPYDWVRDTRDSYKLWLSYAKLGILEENRRLRLDGYQLTQHTHVHKEHLRLASKECIDAYYDWVFPEFYIKKWRKGYEVEYLKYFVSPVHFWFFMTCHIEPPSRPLHPSTPNDMFRHPLFFVARYQGPIPLVVPEYFFNNDASFDGLAGPGTTSYYIFPYFAQKLFEYVAIPRSQRDASFTAYYVSRENAWFVPRDLVDASRFINPHPTLRRHWRWEEVLEMLWSRKGSGHGRCPRWCSLATGGYHKKPQINAYLDRFAEVAEAWEIERQAEPNA